MALWMGTGIWLLGWLLDVGSTLRGIRSAGTVAWERNPFARAILRRLGVGWGFAALALLESSIVAAHWGCVLWISPGSAITLYSAAASLAVAGLAHALAARSNVTGRMPRVLRPVLAVYEWIGRRLAVD